MGFTFGGTQANVSISGSLSSQTPIPGTSQTLINAEAAGNAGSNKTLYTVTAGKTLYVYGFVATTGAAADDAQLKNHAGTVILATKVTQNQTSEVVGGGCPIAVYTAEQNVIVYGGSASTLYSIWGIEQ